MPTLEELFKSKKYDTLGNKTPQEAFTVQNSKDIQIKSTSYTLNKVADPLLNKARKNNSIRLGETRLEQENSGLYQYMVVGSPAIYGLVDTLRITSQSTPLLEAMKAGTGGRGLSFLTSQIVGDTVGEAVKFGGSRALGVPATFQPKSLFAKTAGAVKNSLGSLIPDVLIPSKIVANPIFSVSVPGVSEEYRTHEILANLKALSTGTKLATALARSATGTPDQVRQALQGQVINIAQQETKRFVAKGLSNLLSKGGEKAQQLARELRLNNNAYVRYSSLRKYSEIVGGEKTFGINDGKPANAEGNKSDNDAAKRGLDLSIKWTSEYSGETDAKKRGKQKFAKEMWASNYVDNNPDDNQSLIYSKSWKPVTGLFKRKDWDFKTDSINENGVFDEPQSTESARTMDEADFVPLKITSVANNTSVQFRATISGLSEQFSPSWDNSRFIGSPFNFFTYQSIERTTQFTFKVFALSSQEHKENWKKLGYLSSLCYPQNYESATGAVTAPFLKFTLGDMYRNKECFIENMTYNIDDDFPWEIGLNDNTLKNYRLPMIVEVTMTLKFVETKSNTYNYVSGSTTQNDKKAIGKLLYGWQPSQADAAKAGGIAKKEQFRSTSNTYKTTSSETLNQKPDEVRKKNGEDPWPMDNSEETKRFRKEQKLVETNIYHTPDGASSPRRIYIQKRTGYYYYGDGTPYTAIYNKKGIGPDLKEQNNAMINASQQNPLTRGSILG